MFRPIAVVFLVVSVSAVGGFAQEADRAAPLPPGSYASVDVHFPPGLIDWAELYANPVLEVEPVGFGTVAFERRSFERSVASLVLIAASAFGVYSGLRAGTGGDGWTTALVVAGPSAVGVTAGVQGFTRWSKVRAVRRVGW